MQVASAAPSGGLGAVPGMAHGGPVRGYANGDVVYGRGQTEFGPGSSRYYTPKDWGGGWLGGGELLTDPEQIRRAKAEVAALQAEIDAGTAADVSMMEEAARANKLRSMLPQDEGGAGLWRAPGRAIGEGIEQAERSRAAKEEERQAFFSSIGDPRADVGPARQTPEEEFAMAKALGLPGAGWDTHAPVGIAQVVESPERKRLLGEPEGDQGSGVAPAPRVAPTQTELAIAQSQRRAGVSDLPTPGDSDIQRIRALMEANAEREDDWRTPAMFAAASELMKGTTLAEGLGGAFGAISPMMVASQKRDEERRLARIVNEISVAGLGQQERMKLRELGSRESIEATRESGAVDRLALRIDADLSIAEQRLESAKVLQELRGTQGMEQLEHRLGRELYEDRLIQAHKSSLKVVENFNERERMRLMDEETRDAAIAERNREVASEYDKIMNAPSGSTTSEAPKVIKKKQGGVIRGVLGRP